MLDELRADVGGDEGVLARVRVQGRGASADVRSGAMPPPLFESAGGDKMPSCGPKDVRHRAASPALSDQIRELPPVVGGLSYDDEEQDEDRDRRRVSSMSYKPPALPGRA